jgi:hypothetical protein
VFQELVSELKIILNISYLHLFQVLHVGVGRAIGSVPLISIYNKLHDPLRKLSENSVVINLNSLKKNKKRYSLIRIREKFPVSNKLIPNIKMGDIVAVHWKQVIKVLTKKEERDLTFWTKETLKYFS